MVRLSDYLVSYSTKRLALVDTPGGSHQHELNGKSGFRQLLGARDRVGIINWTYLTDDEDDQISSPAVYFRFYDSRRNQSHRSAEWRLYYGPNDVMDASKPGDLFVLAKVKGTAKNEFHAFVFSSDSSWQRKAALLFGDFGERGFTTTPTDELDARTIQLSESVLLRMLGVGLYSPGDEITELVQHHFGEYLRKKLFPSTAQMSEVARTSLGNTAGTDPDSRLKSWLEREESMFYALERDIVGQRLARRNAFTDVESFVEYANSVTNRRKSRMGRSFENQLEAVFLEARVRFQRNATTERKNRPDFLFPGAHEYRDASFNAMRLNMLGAKSTCKDRWRQVLAEADRITRKHLCTLEPAISEDQTSQMQEHNLTLVVPYHIHPTYTPAQQGLLLSVSAFIEIVRRSQ